MTRARELANFADNTSGLESLTVSDVTDLSVSASNINSATNQITDSSTDLNVDSNTLVVDKSADRVGITNASPGEALHIKTTADADYGIKVENDDTQAFCKVQSSGNALYGGNAGVNIVSGGSFATAMHIDTSGKVGIGTDAPSDLNAAANDLVVKNTGNAGITIFSGTTSSGNLFFADATSGTAEYDGFLQYSQNDQKLDIGTAGASRMTIASSGDVEIASGGDLETSTTGKIKQKGAFMQSSTHQALTLGS